MTPSHYKAVDEFVRLHGKQAARDAFGNLDLVKNWIADVSEMPLDEIPQSLIQQLSTECLEFVDFSLDPDLTTAGELPEEHREFIREMVHTHGKEGVLEWLNDPDHLIKKEAWGLLTLGMELDPELEGRVLEAEIAFVEGLEE